MNGKSCADSWKSNERGPRDTHGQTIRHANPGALNLTAHQAATERRVSETLGLIAANVRNQIVY